MEYVRQEVNNLGALNAELEKIEVALGNKLGTESTGPRVMHSDLDMNSNQILNLPAPRDGTEPARLQDVISLIGSTPAKPLYSVNYGLIGDGRDETVKLQRFLNDAQGKLAVFESGKNYGYTNLEFKDGTTVVTNGSTFTRMDASTVHGVVLRNNITIDRLVIFSPGGAGGDKAILLTGSNFKADRVSVRATAEGTFTSTNWAFEIDSGSTAFVGNIEIGSFLTRNYRNSMFAKRVSGLKVNNIQVEFFQIAFYLQDCQNVEMNNAQIGGMSTTLTGNTGENGILIESTSNGASKNIQISNWTVSDSGEHGFRLGGQYTIQDVFFDNCTSIRPGRAGYVAWPSAVEWHGGCGFKVLGGTSATGRRHRNIHFNNCTVIDCDLNPSFGIGHGINNFTAFQVFVAEDVFLTDCKVRNSGSQAYAALQALIIGSTNNIHVSNFDCDTVERNALRLHDEPPTSPGWSFGINGLYIDGAEFRSRLANVAVCYMDDAKYAHSDWKIKGLNLYGGRAAFRFETPTTGSYPTDAEVEFSYQDSDSDEATVTTPIVTGVAVLRAKCVAPWRVAQTATPSLKNGSEYTDSITGDIRHRVRGQWGSVDVNPVSSVANLRLRVGRFDGEVVSLTSYYAGGTSGGGGLVWRSTSVAADDGGITFAVSGSPIGRWVRMLDGFVTPEMFGAIGDGVTNDATAINAAINSLIPVRLSACTYFLTATVGRTSAATGIKFTGQGVGQTILKSNIQVAASSVKFFNQTDFEIGGFTVIGGYSDGSLSTQGVDCANLTNAIIRDIVAKDCGGQGAWCISGNDTITNENVKMINVRAENCRSSGVQLQGARNSWQIECSAKNVGLGFPVGDSDSGSGVYMKVPLEDCHQVNCHVDGAVLGAFNVGSSFPGVKAKRLNWVGGVAVNCKRGIRIGEVEDSVFSNFALSMDGLNADGLGDGVRLEAGAKNNSFKNISVRGVGASRAAARFIGDASNNSIEITSFKNPTAGALIASFEAGCQNNSVEVQRGFDSVTVDAQFNGTTTNNFRVQGIPRRQTATISSDTVTIEGPAVAYLIVTTEASAATDDLHTINGGVEGQVVFLTTNFNDRDVTVKTAVGNIRLSGNSDFTLSRVEDSLTLMYSARASRWIEISRSVSGL